MVKTSFKKQARAIQHIEYRFNADLSTVIQEYNDNSLRHCVELLSLVLDFDKENINQVGKEELDYTVSAYVHRYLRKKDTKGFRKAYAEEMDFLFKNFDFEKSDEGYKKKVLKVLSLMKKNKGSIEDLEDLFKIYISYIRCLWDGDFYLKNVFQDKPFDFSIKTEDAQMLKRFRTYRLTKRERTKKVLFNTKIIPEYISRESMDFIYLITVLFYCRIMQFEGKYIAEDE